MSTELAVKSDGFGDDPYKLKMSKELAVKSDGFGDDPYKKEKKRLKGSSDQNSEPITYFVHMCEGVIIEVLRYGVRRRLTKLERVGHDFHLIVTNFFSEKPFVRFNLRLEIGNEFVFIGGTKRNKGRKIWQTDIDKLPHFLRFDEVRLDYFRFHFDALSIDEKRKSFVNYFQPLKNELHNSDMINFTGIINENDRSCFNDHLQLLDHIRMELLPICASSLGYKFRIRFDSDKNSATNVADKILQMHPIQRCSNVEISLYGLIGQLSTEFESILNWLNPKHGGINEKSKERLLRIYSYCTFPSALELCDHLKKTFKEAILPGLPYKLSLGFYCDQSIGFIDEVLTNGNTNEELSIRMPKWNFMEINRRGIQKKKKNSRK